MARWDALLAIAAAAVVAATFAPTETSARTRGVMSPAYYDQHYCGGRLPAYGFDGCGHREFGYGPNSCWRRVIVNSTDGPRPRRVYICDPPRGRGSI